MKFIMKKEYIMPVVKVVNLGSESILAGSEGGGVNTGRQVYTGNNDYIGVGKEPWEGEID